MKLNKCVENTKKLRKAFTGALVLCSLLLIGGCATKEQREALAKIEEQAKVNAVDYILEKYGFEAEVVDVEGYTGADDLFVNHEPTGYATVTVKYDGKEFDVYITGEEASSKGEDNYQKDIIWEAVEEKAAAVFDFEVDAIDVDVTYGSVDTDIMTSTYYDGNNMEQMLEEMDCRFNYKVVLLDADLQSIATDNMRDELYNCAEVVIVNCGDTDSYDIMKNLEISSFWMDIYDYGMYMEDFILIDHTGVEYIDLKMVEYDGYTIGLLDGTYCNVTENDVNTSEWVGRGFIEEPKQIFGAYAIETDARRIFIYVNVDSLETKAYEKAQIALTFVKDGQKFYDNGNTSEYILDRYITDNKWIHDYTEFTFTVFEE